MVLYEENLSLYIYIFIHDKLFLYTHWNSFFLRHTVYIQTLFTFKDFHFSQHTLMVHTKVSSYTLVAHTHKNSFPRIIYTQRPSIHIFLLHTCINKNLFSFLYEHDFYSQRFFLFIMILVHFFILDDVPK